MDNYTEQELEVVDLKTLSKLYTQQLHHLNQQLLNSTSWEELAQERKDLTRIGVAFDVKAASESQRS